MQNSAGRLSMVFNNGVNQQQQLLTEYDPAELGISAENQNAASQPKTQTANRESAHANAAAQEQEAAGLQENGNPLLEENEILRSFGQQDRLENQVMATRSHDALHGKLKRPDAAESNYDEKSDNKSQQQSVSGSDMQDVDEMEDDEVIVLEADNGDFIDQDLMQYFDQATSGGGGGLGGCSQINEKDKASQLASQAEQDLEGVCRICLGEEDEPQTNPLFSPCICAGSMGLIHLDCLKEWLKGKKIQRQGEIVSTYFWKNLECELCKQRFPIEIELKNKQKVAILDYELPVYEADEAPHYITLESISSNTSKVVHVLNLIDEDQISIGRGHEIAVRVTDISVSRCHAIIKKSALGFYYIMDNNSKFGTLALVRQPQLINSTCNNFYQIGKTLISFEIEQFENQQSKFVCLSKSMEQKLSACMKNPAKEEELKQRKVVEELIEQAPVKDELVTHDGVVYFPEELMPVALRTEKESLVGSISNREGIQTDRVAPFLQKTKQLNLKLKFKNSKFKKALYLSQFKRQIEGHKSFGTPNLGFMTHRNIERSHTGGGIHDPNGLMQNIGDPHDNGGDQKSEAVAGITTSRYRYDQAPQGMVKRLLNRKTGSLTHRGNRVMPLSSSLVEIPEMTSPDNNGMGLAPHEAKAREARLNVVPNDYVDQQPPANWGNQRYHDETQDNVRQALGMASSMSNGNRPPALLPQSKSVVISGADIANSDAQYFQNQNALQSAFDNAALIPYNSRTDILYGGAMPFGNQLANAENGSASQGALVAGLSNEEYRSIAQNQDEVGGPMAHAAGTIPMPGESIDVRESHLSMRADGTMPHDQFSTVPKTAQGLRDTSEQMPGGRRMPNQQLGNVDLSDPYGASHKRVPSTQFLRRQVGFGPPQEDELGTIGAGTRIGNNALGLGSLSNSDMYDDFAMGLSNSNQRPGLARRPDFPPNMLNGKASAPVLEHAGHMESKMSINASLAAGLRSPPRTPGKEATHDDGDPGHEEQFLSMNSPGNKAIRGKGQILIIERNQPENTIDTQKRVEQPAPVSLSAHFDGRVVARILEDEKEPALDAHAAWGVKTSATPAFGVSATQPKTIQFGMGAGQEEDTAVQILESPGLAKHKAKAQNTPNTVSGGGLGGQPLPPNVPVQPGDTEISVLELLGHQGTEMLPYPVHRETQVVNFQSPEYNLLDQHDQEPPAIPGQIVVNASNHIQGGAAQVLQEALSKNITTSDPVMKL